MYLITDCHDLWLAGHAESGVYSIVRGMEMQPVFCNMTLYGGWTVIQRRMDGTQDFDRGKIKILPIAFKVLK